MAKYSGIYKFLEEENFREYLQGLAGGVDDDIIALFKTIKGATPTFDLEIIGDTVNIVFSIGFSLSFTLGQPFEKEILPGTYLQFSSAFSGNILTIGIFGPNNRKEIREFIFDDTGLVITFSGKSNITARITFVKL